MIVNNATLITFWDKQPLVEGALVAIEGGTIVDFGKVGKLVDRYDHPQVLDAGGPIVIPGLVDAHSHLSRTLLRARPEQASSPSSFRDLRERVWWPLERALGPKELYTSASVGLLDAIRSGVTAIVDHYTGPAASESLDVIWRAFDEVGSRGALCFGVSDRFGEGEVAASVEENLRFIESSRKGDSPDRKQGLFGLDSLVHVTDATLQKAVEAARSIDARFHLPLLQDPEEADQAWRLHGRAPIERLEQAGALPEGSVVAHGTHLRVQEWEALSKLRVTVALCPRSDVVHAAGSADVLRLASAGVNLAVGRDGSDNGAGLLDEYRELALRLRRSGHTMNDSLQVAYRTVFAGGADLATRLFGRPIGRIRPGARADLVVLDALPATPVEEANLPAQIFSLPSRVHSVVVNGKVLLQDGKFVAIDEAGVRSRGREVAKSLWERL